MPYKLKQQIAKRIDGLCHSLIGLARQLHAHPELAFEERKAQAALCDFLGRHGFGIQKGIVLPTDFRATYPSGAANRPAIGFLAEYDALPGLGHACGHNLIAASSVGAAVALASVWRAEWGRIVVLGTPAEEAGGGKISMIKAGALQGLDAALMIHPDSSTCLVKRSLAMLSLKVSFHGKSAHAAASPHEGCNALDGVILAFNNINALRQQIRPEERIHGIITHGGQAPNIIPDFAAAQFMVRARDKTRLDILLSRVRDCLSAAALASHTQLDVEEGLAYAPFKPNYTLTQLFRDNLLALGLAPDQDDEWLDIASTDMGNVSQVLPTIHSTIAICAPGIPVHSPEFAGAAASDLGHARMLLSATALAWTGLDLAQGPGNLEKAKREFESKTFTSGN